MTAPFILSSYMLFQYIPHTRVSTLLFTSRLFFSFFGIRVLSENVASCSCLVLTIQWFGIYTERFSYFSVGEDWWTLFYLAGHASRLVKYPPPFTSTCMGARMLLFVLAVYFYNQVDFFLLPIN